MWTLWLEVALVLFALWFPAETRPLTPLIVSGTALVLLPWAWSRRRGKPSNSAVIGLSVLTLWFVASATSGADPARGLQEIALMMAAITVGWIAARSAPPERVVSVLAIGVAGLTFWAMWQVVYGFDAARLAVVELPPAMRTAAETRLTVGRAFASLYLPGHFAVVLASVVPLFVAGLGRGRRGLVCGVGLMLCTVGLLLSYSVLGMALAIAATAILVLRRRHVPLGAVALVLIAAAVTVVAIRGDLGDLEPVRLRLDNWRTGLWVWSSAPFSGAGLGGFGQASQAVPFGVGNRPIHVHSLPLEMCAEMGVAGLAFFLAAAFWLARHTLRVWRLRPEMAVALAVIPIHNLFDFSLLSSAVAFLWAALFGWSIASISEPTRIDPQRPGRPLAVAATTVAVALALLHASSVLVEESAAAETSSENRFAGAIRAQQLAPWRPRPVAMIASAALEDGRPELIADAANRLAAWRWLRPRSASMFEVQSQLATASGSPADSLSMMWAAARAQPGNATYRASFGDLEARLVRGADDH